MARGMAAAAIIAFALAIGGEAAAAGLVHETRIARSLERGVAVWRRAPVPAAEAPPPRAVAARAERISIRAYAIAWPDRALRTQGFYSGDGLNAGSRRARRVYTKGFYADRMAAGL